MARKQSADKLALWFACALAWTAAAGAHDSSPTQGPAAVCPAYGGPTAQGILREPKLAEISGLAHANTGDYFWVHNDSGDEARFYALSPQAKWLATYRLPGVAKPTDLEDLAVARTSDRSFLYLGDIGDNQRRRKFVSVHRVEEPTLPAGFASPHRELPIGPVTTVRLTYPDGAHDAEAFFVDPISGALVIVTKGFLRPPRIYERATFTDGPLTFRGEMSEEIIGALLLMVTAADVSPTGSHVAVRTYDGAYLFRRARGQTLSEALLGPACPVVVGPEKQGEALALLERAGHAPTVATMSEGLVSTLWFSPTK